MAKKLVIIGNGISGVTTAIELRKKSDMEILIISDESEYFFSRTALMYVYMGHMKFEHTQPRENSFWKEKNIQLLSDKVSEVNTSHNSIKLLSGKTIGYDFLVIATGSKSNKYGWPGQDLKGVTGLYHKQDLDFIEKWSDKTSTAIIVGGGLIGIELAEMLKTRNKKVHFLVREEGFWRNIFNKSEAEIINKHIVSHGVDLQLETELKEIKSNESGEVKSLITSKNEEISCELVGLTAGVSPNIEFIRESGISTNKGIKVNNYLQTNIENVFAIGDCAELDDPLTGRRSIEAVWYTGRIMGETLAKTLAGEKTQYNPGHWFNSAKFFDIEYQTYGNIPADISSNQKELIWEKDDNKSIRIVYDTDSGKFEGINTLGIRMKHSFFKHVLEKSFSVLDVINDLPNANFDPEFYKKYESEIQFEFLQKI